MIKYFRSVSNGTLKESMYHRPIESKGKSVTDKTLYSPKIKNVGQRVESGAGVIPRYDFPDGVDTGARHQLAMRSNLDITEVKKLEEFALSNVNKQVETSARKTKETVEAMINESVAAKAAAKGVNNNSE